MMMMTKAAMVMSIVLMLAVTHCQSQHQQECINTKQSRLIVIKLCVSRSMKGYQ